MFTEIAIGLGVIAWLGMGWYSGVLLRDYFLREYGKSLGTNAWGNNEIFHRYYILAGPFSLISTLICRFLIWDTPGMRPWQWEDETEQAYAQRSWFPVKMP